MTENGSTQPAGEGLTDEQMAEDVSEETSSDLKAEDVFEREADGTDSDAPADEQSADDVQ